MTNPTVAVDQSQVAAKHRAMWASGDYAKLAAELVSPLGPVLVEATGVGPGDRVLDVASGTGNAAIPAAETGASVVASDLCPELLEQGRRLAAERGVDLEWREADAHSLPFGDDEFDVVMSCIGVMFAPFHQLAASELVRVCKPNGRIGVLSWTPEGHIGQLWAAMKPYAPAPRPVHSHLRCGVNPITCGRCSETGSWVSLRSDGRWPSTGSPTAPSSATTSRRSTGRRSRCTATSRAIRIALPPSTRTLRGWATAC
jgi:ubiquinone/menaquinone biosynthesis C-methylase UbiE